MKIWHQSMGNATGLGVYIRAIEAHSHKVCEDGTQVVVHGLEGMDFVTSAKEKALGSSPGDMITTDDLLGAKYVYHLALRRVIEQARRAEQEGYDAFVIGSFSEPYLREVRSAVDIPVASAGESNFLLACSYGKFQAHIADTPVVARMVADHVHEYRLTDRVAMSAALGPEVDEFYMQDAWADPAALIDRFVRIARAGIEAGTDVILPVEGVLSELLFINGIKKVGQAPVFDCFGNAWKYAELLVNLRRKSGLEVGREWEYRRVTDAQAARVRRSLGLDAPASA